MKLRFLALALPLALGTAAFGQSAESSRPALARFDLDFPGGTPAELVAAIQTAQGHTLNAVIPADEAQTLLPPLKLKQVNVKQLFGALYQADTRQRGITNSSGGTSYTNISFGFKTEPSETVTNDTVWYFRDDRTLFPPVCRFFLLTPYLSNGLTVDDITTAIQTGWKMQGSDTPLRLNFHKETGLLIAVGESAQLGLIDSVLRELGQNSAKTASRPAM